MHPLFTEHMAQAEKGGFQSAWKALAAQLRAAVRPRLPDVQVLLALHTALSHALAPQVLPLI